jgi:16S rRNA (adenine1518-N6/adenine1519-N6)-dimethyltransferase
MIQKEVADRIVSERNSKVYGILSVLLQSFYDIERLFIVPPGVFHPPPKVQSAVIRLRRNERESLACDEVLFKKVVKAGFGKRRKTLRNALKDLILPLPADESELLALRAEQLSIDDFVRLTAKISANGGHAV